jgi:sulfide:quinone oxidoreductase
MSDKYQVLVVGGGAAGISVAARLCEQPHAPSVGIVEPSETHYYQPIWTLVGGGVFPREISARPEKDYIPRGAHWIRDRVATFEPDRHAVVTEGGQRIEYEQLVVTAGIQLDWDAIEGLDGGRRVGTDGICSNYTYETVSSTWETLQTMQQGNAIFTFPAGPIKCAGAPQKIMYLADDFLRRRNVRSQCDVIYAAGTPAIFGVKEYADALDPIVQRKGIQTHFKRDLVQVRPEKKEAVFRSLDGGDELVLNYSLLHVVPPQSAPDFIKKSPLAVDDPKGWVDVHKHTLQHVRYPDVFSLGDCSSLPCSKTGAAVRKQAPVLVENLTAHRQGREMTGFYDGYASCPLVTGYGKLILAEFKYGGALAETFPFDQTRERYSMYALKAYGLPQMYWNGMLRGRA